MNDNSWFKLYRKMLGWEWFTDSKTLHVFVFLLARANIKSSRWNGRVIRRGQLVSSYNGIANATGMSVSSARRAVGNLLSTGEIAITPTNKYTIFTIVKYDEYQSQYADFEQAEEHTGEHSAEHSAEQHHKKKEKNRERKNIPAERKAKPAPAKSRKKEYVPQYWEIKIPKHYWGRFDSEDDYYAYAAEHAEEVEQWLTN